MVSVYMPESVFSLKYMLLLLMVIYYLITFLLLNIKFPESSLYPDATDIREKVIDRITNQIQYPLHILSIDDVR
jgi:hypothetical protein